MNDKLDKLLVKRYPEIFRDRYKSPRETCMFWGFECGDGWFLLIDQLCDQIQHHIDQSVEYTRMKQSWHAEYVRDHQRPYTSEWSPWINELTSIPQVVALQVKEKFGTLRFYYSGGDERIAGYVSLAEHLSASICETCGAFGLNVGRTHRGWIQTACAECASGIDPARKWQLPKSHQEGMKALHGATKKKQ